MPDVQVPLLPTHYYHIYNHAIGKENIFNREEDYCYLLVKMQLHILPVCHILSYCLMPNHFHFVAEIKSKKEVLNFFESKLGSDKLNRKMTVNEDFISDQISQQFSNLFNTYAKHYNFQKHRTGSLFKRNFRRTEITDMNYMRTVICYVHQNPVKAGLANKMTGWKFSSYIALTSNFPTQVARDETMELFDGLKNFHAWHEIKCELP